MQFLAKGSSPSPSNVARSALAFSPSGTFLRVKSCVTIMGTGVGGLDEAGKAGGWDGGGRCRRHGGERGC